MIYHPDDHIVIHTPSRTGGKSLLEALKPTGWIGTNHISPREKPLNILLMRHPVARIASIYKQYSDLPCHYQRLRYKTWLKSKPPQPQSLLCENPDHTIRLEYLASDLRKLGIPFLTIPHLNQSKPMEVHNCLASQAFIRSTYAEDYDLGDYE